MKSSPRHGLDDVPIVRVYSRHALESVLSETDIKQILGGIRSQTTLEYVSKYCGETTEVVSSFSLGADSVQESLSQTGRRLITEDELRRLPAEAQIVLHSNLKPMLCKKVQVFAVANWRRRITPNSLYGGRSKLLPVEVRVGWFGARVTAVGQRAYIKGLFSNSTTRGLSPELIKLALSYERAHQGKAIGALATIRIQADDVVNPAVARVFGRLGFFPRTRGVFKATPCARLRHLVPTANRFEDGKPVFEALHMALTPADASRLVAEVA
ncbi:MAG: type IV secretory system conjugative DNA transfer family protein [Pseudomonadota bacterium]